MKEVGKFLFEMFSWKVMAHTQCFYALEIMQTLYCSVFRYDMQHWAVLYYYAVDNTILINNITKREIGVTLKHRTLKENNLRRSVRSEQADRITEF